MRTSSISLEIPDAAGRCPGMTVGSKRGGKSRISGILRKTVNPALAHRYLDIASTDAILGDY